MSNRDFGVIMLGRFLVVERYRETHLSSSTRQLRSAGPDRTGGHPSELDSRSSFRASARPQHG
jgi:hypothetical protein